MKISITYNIVGPSEQDKNKAAIKNSNERTNSKTVYS